MAKEREFPFDGPEPLNGREKKFLRGLGQGMKESLHVGRGGVSAGVVAELDRSLNEHRLVKVRIRGDRTQRREVADLLAESVSAMAVGEVGATLLLFRQKTTETDRAAPSPVARSPKA